MKKKRVLVVDDEKDFTDMIKMNLEVIGGYEVMVENKGSKALESAKYFRPDMIFLDIIMPDMDGGAVLYLLENDRDTAGIPVVFLTAIMTESEVAEKNNLIGGKPFLAKPVSLSHLINCIKKHIG